VWRRASQSTLRHHHSPPSTSTRGTSTKPHQSTPSLQPLPALPSRPSRSRSTASLVGDPVGLSTGSPPPKPISGELEVSKGRGLEGPPATSPSSQTTKPNPTLPRIGLNHHLDQDGAIPLKDQLHATPPSPHQSTPSLQPLPALPSRPSRSRSTASLVDDSAGLSTQGPHHLSRSLGNWRSARVGDLRDHQRRAQAAKQPNQTQPCR
jgi:hypothetical protein